MWVHDDASSIAFQAALHWWHEEGVVIRKYDIPEYWPGLCNGQSCILSAPIVASVASATLGQARVGIYIIDWAPKTTIDTRSHLSNHPVSPNIALSDLIFGVCFRHCNLFSGMTASLSNFFVHYYQPQKKINYCHALLLVPIWCRLYLTGICDGKCEIE